jgi:amino acid transporter
VLAFLGTIAVAVSLAEMASIYPTAGGQYHWVAGLAPRKYRKSASWFTGWISIGGQICLTASAAFAGGLQLRGMISLNDANYVPTQWQGMLFYWAVLAYALVTNLWGSRTLSIMNLAAGKSLFIHCLVFHLSRPQASCTSRASSHSSSRSASSHRNTARTTSLSKSRTRPAGRATVSRG